MKVVLLERIEKLGRIGDVVKIKNGYGRNYLLPNGKALRATPKNMKIFEETRQEYEARNKDKFEQAKVDISRIQSVVIKIVTQAQSSGILYGSIAARDIEAKLKELSFVVPTSKIYLPHPIKEAGLHEVEIRMHPEVSCKIPVYVSGSAEELAKMLSSDQPSKEEEPAAPKKPKIKKEDEEAQEEEPSSEVSMSEKDKIADKKRLDAKKDAEKKAATAKKKAEAAKKKN